MPCVVVPVASVAPQINIGLSPMRPVAADRKSGYLERCASATGKIMQVVEPWA
jgi:hypothetical protein